MYTRIYMFGWGIYIFWGGAPCICIYIYRDVRAYVVRLFWGVCVRVYVGRYILSVVCVYMWTQKDRQTTLLRKSPEKTLTAASRWRQSPADSRPAPRTCGWPPIWGILSRKRSPRWWSRSLCVRGGRGVDPVKGMHRDVRAYMNVCTFVYWSHPRTRMYTVKYHAPVVLALQPRAQRLVLHDVRLAQARLGVFDLCVDIYMCVCKI